jgi:hypothetical protein
MRLAVQAYPALERPAPLITCGGERARGAQEQLHRAVVVRADGVARRAGLAARSLPGETHRT